jgi:Arc/MetJ-type ribon-helix-helix transcriptional regulator
MATHSLTIELSDDAYRSLKQRLGSGRYATADEAIADALLDDRALPPELGPAAGESYDDWLRVEAISAYDEQAASPGETYTSRQVLAYLEAERALDIPAR